MKTRPVIGKLFHADGQIDGRTDGQTDITKLIIAFCISAHAPENGITHFLREYFGKKQGHNKSSCAVLPQLE
jgi:hypothetical protein